MTHTIALEDTVAVVSDQVAADVGGELIILNMASGEYYGLNEVGSRIWELMGEPRRVAEIRDQILLEYGDVDSDRCTADLLALLMELRCASLVELR